MYTLPKTTLRVFPLIWYWWPKFWGLAHGLIHGIPKVPPPSSIVFFVLLTSKNNHDNCTWVTRLKEFFWNQINRGCFCISIMPFASANFDFTSLAPCLLRSIFGVLARNHLSPLCSFRGLLLPAFQLNDDSMGASVEEIGPERTHITPWTHNSEVHESTKRTATVNVCDIPRIWQTYDANVTHVFPLRLLVWKQLRHSDYL